jgi:HTH-type transcriptional repressor of NAD biosynthesis genes
VPPHEHALVVGKFAPLHLGHEYLLRRAGEVAEQVTVLVWSEPDFPEMPSPVRAGWVRSRFPRATVLALDGPANDAPGPVHWAYVRQVLDEHGLAPDVVLSSEAYGEPFAAHLGIRHEPVDPDRVTVPVSGTAIRADVHAHRHLLDPLVYAHFVERVVFMGAESTGKSTLAARMAAELGTVHVGEYGRDHYEAKGGDLDLEDYVVIARRHRELEDETAQAASRWLFVDTNAVTTMFFSHYYNRDSLPELRALADDCAARYRHVIVCDDDIPFEQDGWRDTAEWRTRMQGMVLHDLAVRGIHYHLVRGTLDERVAQVMAILHDETSVSTPAARGSTGPRPACADAQDLSDR